MSAPPPTPAPRLLLHPSPVHTQEHGDAHSKLTTDVVFLSQKHCDLKMALEVLDLKTEDYYQTAFELDIDGLSLLQQHQRPCPPLRRPLLPCNPVPINQKVIPPKKNAPLWSVCA